MKLSPPKMITWVIALILLVLALLGHLTSAVAILNQYDFWLAALAAALMLIATVVKGL
jgi:hypothetical protein